MHHPRTVLALVLTGTLLLGAGCSDEGAEADPQPILPSSSSASPTDEPSPSPSPTEAPTMPAAAEERTLGGAEAFVRHWVDTFNYSTSTGATQPLETLSDDTCEGCANIVSATDVIYDAGGRIESTGWKIRRVGVTPGETVRAPSVAAQIQRSSQRVFQTPEGRADRYEGGPAAYIFDLTWSGGWRMAEVEVVDS